LQHYRFVIPAGAPRSSEPALSLSKGICFSPTLGVQLQIGRADAQGFDNNSFHASVDHGHLF
jgi:hypothetical protein